MSSLLTVSVPDETQKQIENLIRLTGKPRETVIREVVETGLESFQTTPTKSVQALLDLAQWAEKNNITGPKDLSAHHNKYAWE